MNLVFPQMPIQADNLHGPIGAAFLLLISSIFSEKANLGSRADYPADYGPKLLKSGCKCFDFIIVGGGTAGAILANRLTEEENWTVLLLEAGDYPSATSEVPAFYTTLAGTVEDWNFFSEAEKQACQGLTGKRCRISRGKVIGGTSTINNLQYVRAIPKDFENWPENPQYGWSLEQIYKNYEMLENCTRDCDKRFVYETGGDIPLSDLNGHNEYKQLIMDGAHLMGYEKMATKDYVGYVEVLGTLNQGVRENLGKAFLKTAKRRKNLAMVPKAFVTKIVTQLPVDRRIQGVNVRIGREEFLVKAKKEVILTAGAVNTAHLLLLSGFGPKKLLEQHNIPVVADLNVGKGFQDQISTLIFVGLNKETFSFDKTAKLVDDTFSFAMHREGELAHTNINDLIGFINTKSDSTDIPNLMIYHYLFPKEDTSLEHYLKSFGFVDKIIKSIVNQNKAETLILFMPTLTKPESSGEILLNSKDPYEQPKIKANFFSDSGNEDFYTLLSGAKYVLEMIETPPFKTRNAHFLQVDMPACRNYKYCNEPYLKCAVKAMSIPMSQPIGTAAFGNIANCNPCRVVDEAFLVDGIRHLRIVDGSVIPRHISASLEATVAMMAENIAHQMKLTWRNSKTKSLRCDN